MTTLDDLYVYYCRQHGALANSGFRTQLQTLYRDNSDSRQIQQLSLRANYLGPKGLLPVVDLIRNVHSLQRVDLSGNGLDNDGAAYLCDALAKHPSLVHIDLSRSALHDGCAERLLRFVTENERIASLPLSGNNLSSTARDKIGRVVDRNREEVPARTRVSLDGSDAAGTGLVPDRRAPFRAILEEYVPAAESGGSLAFEYTWRRNPQIRLAISKASRVRIQLTVSEPMPTRLIGFAVLKTRDARKALITTRRSSERDQPAADSKNSGTSDNNFFMQRIEHDQAFVPATFVAETAFSDTCCVLELDLDKSSTPCDSYVIVPYTFQPGKSFAYTLVAEVPPALDCATVTLEKVPDMDAWLVQEYEGAWSAESSAGGAIGASAAWRLNDMLRVTLDTERTKSEPHRMQAAATFFVVVSIQNEERTSSTSSSPATSAAADKDLILGCDVLLPESSEFGAGQRRPIRAQNRLFAFPHSRNADAATRNTTICFAFDRRCNAADVDFFIMPSLLRPGVAKSYKVAVYSNTCVQVALSSAAALSAGSSNNNSGGDVVSDSWCWKQLPEAEWGVETCGGCRADNPTTWINNPCYRVLVPGPRPVDALIVVTTPGPAGGGSFRTSGRAPAAGGVATHKPDFDFMVEVDEASDNCKRSHSSVGAMSKHSSPGAGWVQAGEGAECAVWADRLMPGEHWIVPQTRLPGVFAAFRVNIFSSSQILVLAGNGAEDATSSSSSSSSFMTPLSAILRAKQLARYQDSNAKRAQQAQDIQQQLNNNNNGPQSPDGTTTMTARGSASAAISATAAVQHYGASGEMFTDREFPRGASSLWLNASDRPLLVHRSTPAGSSDVVPDFPDVHEWQRLSEMVTTPMFSPIHDHPSAAATTATAAAGTKIPTTNVRKVNAVTSAVAAAGSHSDSSSNARLLSNVGVTVQGVDDAWFLSAVAAVCSKRALAASLILQHDFAVGIFQFRFFKHGAAHTVTVDDYVPVDGASELCFARSHHPDDVFFPLVEKAYAKLHRCYEAIDAYGTTPPDERARNALWDPTASARPSNGFAGSGLLSQALADLTGGIPIERCLFEHPGDGGATREWIADTHSRGGLWRTLLDAHTEQMLVAVRVCDKQPRGAEKCAQSGLLMNRLYPVLEAKEAEGVKLVLLLNVWGWESQERADAGGWKGKWALNNNNSNSGNSNNGAGVWTEARRLAFDTKSRPSNSFWVSLDELHYYFGVVHYVDLGTAVARMSCPLAAGGPPESSEWDKNAQIALNLPPLSAAAAGAVTSGASTLSVRVIVGLHEADRRLRINRAEGATVDYIRQRPALRIAVLQTQQNERRITVLSSDPNECVILSTKGEQRRDMYYTFDVPLSSCVQQLAGKNDRFVLMPCFDEAVTPSQQPPPPRLDLVLSVTFARCAGTAAFGAVGSAVPAPTLRRIEADQVVSIAGEWKGSSAGGPPDYAEWRSNPQFLLFLNSGNASNNSSGNSSGSGGGKGKNDDEDEMTVTVVLRQRNSTNSTVDHIGFSILDTTQVGARVMKYPPASSVVARVPFENSPAVGVSVRLQSVQRRRGLPYVIVPCTSKPGAETGFELSVITNRGAQLRPLASEFDWKVVRLPEQKISVAAGTAGGSTKFSSWRNNPQYCVRFPVGRSGRLVVTMIKRGASTLSSEQIGLVAFYGEDFQGGRRKRLSYAADDIAGMGSSTCGPSAELDITFDCDGGRTAASNTNSNNGRAFTSLLIMPFSELPYSEVDYTLTFHCTVDVTVDAAQEWHQYQHEAGWVAGKSAGGPRHAHGWVTNPFFAVSVPCATRIFVLVMQYPHGPEKLIARKVGRQRVYIPPPIVNDHLAVEFGVDLVDSGPSSSSAETGSAPAAAANSSNLLPVIACSKPSRLHETYVSTVLDRARDGSGGAAGKNQVFIVPYTATAGTEADFKVLVYSDHPIECTQLPPADPYRGRTF